MESRLVPINAWLALLRGEGGWPAPLRESGFRIHRLEAPVSTSASLVVVDGLAVADSSRVVLATEAKSGNNIDAEQAQKYRVMTALDVERQHGLPFAGNNAILEPLASPHVVEIRQGP